MKRLIFSALRISAYSLLIFNGTRLNAQTVKKDWLLDNAAYPAKIYAVPEKKEVVLDNGLLKRTFRISPDVACVDFINLMNGQQLLRAVKPEARLVIDGRNYNVGGLYGQKENAYLLPSWIKDFKAGDSSFHYVAHQITELRPFLNWKTQMWAGNKKQAVGKVLSFSYQSDLPALKNIEVQVNYAIYDGLPLITKWLSIKNNSGKSIQLDQVVNEVLAVVEEESAVVGAASLDHTTARGMKVPQGIYLESNFAFNNAMRYPISDQSTHWKVDKSYTSQVNYDYQTPCLLEVHPSRNIGVELKAGTAFQSIRTNELLMDSYDRERRGLAIRKMYRTTMPWTTANPIFMHLVSKNDEEVRNAIDQCAATGYEALILSFGSHCNMEDTSSTNLHKWKTLSDYAHSKGLFIGSYSLFSSRKISDADDVIDPKTGKPGGAFFGNAPCFGSNWGLGYLKKLKTFMSKTGFDIFENDGPYPGDVCASTSHPGHKGLEDSQWKQMELQKSLYHWCNENGIYVNAPDWYFMDGINKIGIGYREVNFSLSREQQMILNRQNIFDGTWDEIPSMVWGFVPLTKYQGGGPEAVLEPLKDHLKDYEQLMVQYYGAGIQACYRGPRLYDTEETKKMVQKVVGWYKENREILNADIIHLRRADGRDWDGLMHVNPQLKTKGMILLYNPLKEEIKRELKIPMYYTGLKNTATLSIQNGISKKYTLDREYNIKLPVIMKPESYTWIKINE